MYNKHFENLIGMLSSKSYEYFVNFKPLYTNLNLKNNKYLNSSIFYHQIYPKP